MKQKDYFAKLSKLVYLIDQVNFALVWIHIGLYGTKEFYNLLSTIAAAEEKEFPKYESLDDISEILCDKKKSYIMKLMSHLMLAIGQPRYFANEELSKLWSYVMIDITVKAVGTDYGKTVYETCHKVLNAQKSFFDVETYERIIETWLSVGYYTEEDDDNGNLRDSKQMLN